MSTRAGPPAIPREIEHVVQQIVAKFRPQRVILFGSYAYGAPTEDSDADLLVIMETTERPIRAAARVAAAIDHPLPLDILVSTPEDFSCRLHARDSFISDVAKRGAVLYEARNGGAGPQS